MPVISVSMPAELIDRLDELTAEHGYSGRSEALREGTRRLLTEFDDDGLDQPPLAAVVTVAYDSECRGVERQVASIRHDFDELVASFLHGHVDDHCLDLFVFDGPLGDLSGFVGRLRAVDGVETVEYSILPATSDRVVCPE